MPRYEFSEGTSNKFWEIKLNGSSFTTTYGKIGTPGQTTLKQWKDAAEAKREHDKLVAEKTKKGYELVADGGGDTKDEDDAPPPPKAVTKPVAAQPAAAKPASAGGARYFEFSEGTSNKFWEIAMAGNAVKTRYGKLGTAGQQTLKEFGDAGAAQKEYDKLVHEKTKKGYEERGAPGAPDPDDEPSHVARPHGAGSVRDARNRDLEQAIAADPNDRQAYAVFGDWLQEQGDPRGELIALQLGNKDKSAKALIEEHADYFLGPLAEHQKTRDGLSNNSQSHLRTSAQEKEWQKTGEQAFLWRNGFIHRVRLSHDSYADEEWDGKTAEVLDQVLSHPSGRYVVEFSFMSNGDPNEDNLQDLIDVLSEKAPATTRKLTFGDNVDQISWHHTGNLEGLWRRVPNLRVLEMETGEFDVGKMVAPGLERAIFITGGLSKACGANLAAAKLPKLSHLEIYYGTEDYGGDCSVEQVLPLLARTDLPNLRYLGIKNAMFQNDIARAIAGSKLVKQLETLDLSMGAMTDEGAEALAAAKPALPNLQVLDVHRNFLTSAGIKALKGLAPKIISGEQEEADMDGDNTYYYVAIAE